MNSFKNLISIAVLGVAITGCSEAESYESYDSPPANEETETLVPPAEQGVKIPVQSDGADYVLISSKMIESGNLEIVTRRDGISGRNFARREVNCGAMTFRYLSEGDTLTEALSDQGYLGDMSVAFSTSISGEISRFACKQ
ncbi:MAG: hypothetical protein ABJP48_00060 [Erythrobacter sp.]